METSKGDERPHVVIVGGGFAGLTAAKSLKRAPVRVTVIDRCNYHLFQPLLYQVAMAGLSPADIASPIRHVLRKQRNASVLMAEIEGVDLERKVLALEKSEIRYREMPYDTLVLATGVQTSYFGHDGWQRHAVGLKTIDDALEIRRRVLLAFEAAERERDSERRARLLTFVVVGGGPTGVELAGALVELKRFVLARDFREIDPASARVILLEGAGEILASFPKTLSAKARAQLEKLGAEVRLGGMVSEIDAEGVWVGDSLIPSATVVWAAGVRATPLSRSLGVELDRMGRVVVGPDLTIPEHPDAFVVGDLAAFTHQTGSALPGVAPVATQQGRFVAEVVKRRLKQRPVGQFRYRDKGSMATIGRKAAIATVGKLKLSGFLAWVTWLLVHIIYLIGFRNRAVVLLNWMWSYFTYGRGSRLITGGRMFPGAPGMSSDRSDARDSSVASVRAASDSH